MNNMPQVAIGYAVLLIILGLSMYLYSGQQSWTALIPAIFALPVLLSGLIARKEKFLKLGMHIAASLGLLGIFATFKGFTKFPALLSGAEFDRPLAIVTQSLMCALSLIFVGLCVTSFVKVRRARNQA